MRRLCQTICIALTLICGWGLWAAPPAQACPTCKLTVPSGQEQREDADRSAVMVADSAGQGYNLSIMLMMAAPFVLLGLFAGGLFLTMRQGHMQQAADDGDGSG